MKKELVKKTQDATSFLSSLNKVEAKIRGLLDKANATIAAQGKAKERAEVAKTVAEVAKAKSKEAKVKAAKAEEKLKGTLESKEAKIKAADKKAYAKGQVDVDEAGYEEVEVDEANEEVEVTVGAKFPTLNDQVLDLTKEDGDEVSKNTSPTKADDEKCLEATLLEIDAEVTDEKSATLLAEAETLPIAKVEQPEINAEDLALFDWGI
ncbi:uncharacterized protein LOC114288216 [Camellia sinensis]|uniref:uncharacterized protein LOC114288216 n=1 Tax=Camellia sinensis TaxID=4442 RepID=UPI001035785D|nr:uncharacterized protein LOC114288216 [Camellia sinensis]